MQEIENEILKRKKISLTQADIDKVHTQTELITIFIAHESAVRGNQFLFYSEKLLRGTGAFYLLTYFFTNAVEYSKTNLFWVGFGVNLLLNAIVSFIY